jgi:hypothetical protein
VIGLSVTYNRHRIPFWAEPVVIFDIMVSNVFPDIAGHIFCPAGKLPTAAGPLSRY